MTTVVTSFFVCFLMLMLFSETYTSSYMHAVLTFGKQYKWNQTTGSRRLQLKRHLQCGDEDYDVDSGMMTLTFGNLIFTVYKSTVQSKHNRLVILAVMKATSHTLWYQPTAECVLILSAICSTSCVTICIASWSSSDLPRYILLLTCASGEITHDKLANYTIDWT